MLFFSAIDLYIMNEKYDDKVIFLQFLYVKLNLYKLNIVNLCLIFLCSCTWEVVLFVIGRDLVYCYIIHINHTNQKIQHYFLNLSDFKKRQSCDVRREQN